MWKLQKLCSRFVAMWCWESRRLLRIEMLFLRRFEVNMRFMHLGSRWISWWNWAGFPSGLRLILLLVFLEIRCQRHVYFPHLNPIHSCITTNNIKMQDKYPLKEKTF
jgi:hypothetical protein